MTKRTRDETTTFFTLATPAATPAPNTRARCFLGLDNDDVVRTLLTSYVCASDALRTRACNKACAKTINDFLCQRASAPWTLNHLAGDDDLPHFTDLLQTYTQSYAIFYDSFGVSSTVTLTALHPRLAAALRESGPMPTRRELGDVLRAAVSKTALHVLHRAGAQRFAGMFYGVAMFSLVAGHKEASALREGVGLGTKDLAAEMGRLLSPHTDRPLAESDVILCLDWLVGGAASLGGIDNEKDIARMAAAVSCSQPAYSQAVAAWLVRTVKRHHERTACRNAAAARLLKQQQKELRAAETPAAIAARLATEVAVRPSPKPQPQPQQADMSDGEEPAAMTLANDIVRVFSYFAASGGCVSWQNLLSKSKEEEEEDDEDSNEEDEGGFQQFQRQARPALLDGENKRAVGLALLKHQEQAGAAQATRPNAHTCASPVKPRDFFECWGEDEQVVDSAMKRVWGQEEWRDAYSDTVAQDLSW
eukprot:g2769.t1